MHNAVPITETERYPSDLAVSGSKQSAGMTFVISLRSGKSEVVRLSAFPLRPENLIPSKLMRAPGLSLLSLLLFPPPTEERRSALGMPVAMLTRVSCLDADDLVGAKALADDTAARRTRDEYFIVLLGGIGNVSTADEEHCERLVGRRLQMMRRRREEGTTRTHYGG